MDIDFEKIANGVVDIVKGSFNENLPKFKELGKSIVDEQKEVLKDLAEQRLQNKITDEQLRSELEDEKETVENQIRAAKVMSKKAGQDTANAVQKFLGDTVIALVKAVI